MYFIAPKPLTLPLMSFLFQHPLRFTLTATIRHKSFLFGFFGTIEAYFSAVLLSRWMSGMESSAV